MNNEKEKTLENKYTGETAENYLSFRVSEPHWDKEQKIVWEMLKTMDLEKGSTVVDVPVGTGRFLKYYHDIELDCLGYDISNDMLEKAQDEVTHFSYESIKLSKADIRELPLSDDQAQLVVCIRYMQHVSFEEFKVVLRELTRVSSHHILLGVHLIETGFATRVNWLCTIVKSPWSNLRRAYKSVLRRVQRVSSKGKDHSGPASQGYMHRTDKPKSLVLEEFQRNGLKVRAERRILVGLNPRKVSVYRIFWLERS